MKTSIWVNNKIGNHFEIYNTAECLLSTGEAFSHLDCCKGTDLVCRNPNLMKDPTLIHESDDKRETEYIIKVIQNKLYEKSQLLQQVGALKKMNDDSVSDIIDSIKKDLHDNYFEISIDDILKDYNT